MNVASLSLCYPSPETPRAGLFVQRRLAAMARSVHVRVVHPVLRPIWAGSVAGVQQHPGPPPVWHVPLWYVPGISKPFNVGLYVRAVYPVLAEWAQDGGLDIIDAHFIWPDGVAAARLADKLGVPYAITLRGLLGRYAGHGVKRKGIVRALQGAAAVIAVSESLRHQAIQLGISEQKVHVIGNGVNVEMFKPGDRAAARGSVDLPQDGEVLITVGHLCRRKGVHRVLKVMPRLLRDHPHLRYVVVGADGGEGRFEWHLRRQTRRLGLEDRVTFTGALDPPSIVTWLQAADVFVLATRNEGCCNALGEALATGLPVVCTDVGGNRELVPPTAGLVVPFGDGRTLIEAVDSMLRSRPHRAAIAKTVCERTWARTGFETAALLRNAVRQGSPHSSESTLWARRAAFNR